MTLREGSEQTSPQIVFWEGEALNQGNEPHSCTTQHHHPPSGTRPEWIRPLGPARGGESCLSEPATGVRVGLVRCPGNPCDWRGNGPVLSQPCWLVFSSGTHFVGSGKKQTRIPNLVSVSLLANCNMCKPLKLSTANPFSRVRIAQRRVF